MLFRALGRHACLHLIDGSLLEPLPQDTLIHYDLVVSQDDGAESNIVQWAPLGRAMQRSDDPLT